MVGPPMGQLEQSEAHQLPGQFASTVKHTQGFSGGDERSSTSKDPDDDDRCMVTRHNSPRREGGQREGAEARGAEVQGSSEQDSRQCLPRGQRSC